MANLQSISYPFDQHYLSSAFENAKQVFAKPYAVGDLYVFSKAACFVQVLDSKDGVHAPSTTYPGRVYPIAAGGYVFRSWHGDGYQFKNGLWVGAYSTADLAVAGGAPDSGNVIWIETNYRRGRLPNAS
jgi:hypothetical protein